MIMEPPKLEHDVNSSRLHIENQKKHHFDMSIQKKHAVWYEDDIEGKATVNCLCAAKHQDVIDPHKSLWNKKHSLEPLGLHLP